MHSIEEAVQDKRHGFLHHSTYAWLLVGIFIVTLPLSNPWVRGDGVGYYAFARSMLIEHRLDFTNDWLHANNSFRMNKSDAQGNIDPEEFTVTGHLNNHFAVGSAILWSPFLLATHAGVLVYDKAGGHIAPDGYSKPYIVAMAFSTALYGFLALLISFALARRYVDEAWAFLATLGIWFGSSLPVYMYFNPSWSHADSAFSVALFVWYWFRTRGSRTPAQYLVLGALAGLMLDVYYINAALLVFPLLEWLGQYGSRQQHSAHTLVRILRNSGLFAAATLAAFLPTLIAKKIIYGSFLNFGYTEHWYWRSPAFFKVCFSADHGLFSWTPILILALIGLFVLRNYDQQLGNCSLAAFLVYLYAIGCYQDWHGISSYGNRFFVALTPLFVLGLAAFFDRLARAWQPRRAKAFAWAATALFVVWNLGLVFQWGMHLIPERGPVSWREAAYNQVAVVPVEMAGATKNYLTRRTSMMNRIEQQDVQQLKAETGEGKE
jgi:hypothetical protein